MKIHTRGYHILESVQYALLYMISAFLGGVGLDFAFPHYDSKKPTEVIVKEVLLQCILLVLVVYFVRYCVKSVPLLFPIGKNYVPYKTPEFNGEMMMGFVFLGAQLNLIQKIDLLSTKLYNYFFEEDRKIKDGKYYKDK
jgi:hypothetical protein